MLDTVNGRSSANSAATYTHDGHTPHALNGLQVSIHTCALALERTAPHHITWWWMAMAML